MMKRPIKLRGDSRTINKNLKVFLPHLLILVFLLLHYMPVIISYVNNPDIAIYNSYVDEESGEIVATPDWDVIPLYVPFINKIAHFKFGDPLLKEHSDTYINLMPAISLVPFVILSELLGINLGLTIGVFLFNFLVLFMAYTLIRRVIKKDIYSVLLSFLIYIILATSSPGKLIKIVKTLDPTFYLFNFFERSYLIRFPSLSLTLFFLLLSIYLIVRLDHDKLSNTKRALFILLIGINGIIYFYNFTILFTLCGLLLLFYLLKKNYQGVLNQIGILATLSITFLISFIPKQAVQQDHLLGMAKYGLVTIHAITKENAGALFLFAISAIIYYLYFRKNKKSIFSSKKIDITTIVFLFIMSLTIQGSLNIITGFQVQLIHLLDYYAFFIPLLVVYVFKDHINIESKITKTVFYLLGFLIILLLILNFSPIEELRPMDPQIKKVFAYINENKIQGSTFMALDDEENYILPAYTRNYVYVGNTFSTYINTTENMKRLSQKLFIYNKTSEYLGLYEDKHKLLDLFHFAYIYQYHNPPCDTCLFDGEKKELTWLSGDFLAVPDSHKKIYEDILSQEFELEDYNFDYILINKEKQQQIRWPERFQLVYENPKYALLRPSG